MNRFLHVAFSYIQVSCRNGFIEVGFLGLKIVLILTILLNYHLESFSVLILHQHNRKLTENHFEVVDTSLRKQPHKPPEYFLPACLQPV